MSTPPRTQPRRSADERRSGEEGRAVVIGSSISGLFTARVLSGYFGRVTLIERDRLPLDESHRPGVPQGHHVHTLLGGGVAVFKRYFPDLIGDHEDGLAVVDWARDLRWHHYGGYKPSFESGIHAVMSSRPVLESKVRRRVLRLPQVELLEDTRVTGLVADLDHSRIRGVRVRRTDSEAELTADLVVDTTGRGSRSPQWLEGLGYPRPPEHRIHLDFRYTSRVYRRAAGALNGFACAYVLPAPPHGRRAGALCSIEEDAWLVTLGGWLGEPAPRDEGEFLDFARSLPAPDIFEAIERAQPLTAPVLHRFPSNLRRLYEKMPRFPDGYLVLGDALCSFNPIYAQGMTTSALAAAALDGCLGETIDRGRGLDGMAKRFFAAAAKINAVPWRLAAGEDFRYAEVHGDKPPGTDLVNRYMTGVHRATLVDPKVYRAFLEVMHLQAPPHSLLRPGIALRSLRSRAAFP